MKRNVTPVEEFEYLWDLLVSAGEVSRLGTEAAGDSNVVAVRMEMR